MIFFDSNAGDAESGYILWFPKSLEGLSKIPGGAREGIEVDLIMPGEISCRGILKFDHDLGYWRALEIEGTMKIIPPE
ncbi:hypothetical protein [Sphingopyxis chilensis]